MKIIVSDRSRLRDAAIHFLRETAGSRIFAFYGQMGSGKTTFIKALCSEMGVTDTVTSPSFTLVNEYKSQGRYHVEFNASSLASGIYFYKIQTGNFSAIKKLILMR